MFKKLYFFLKNSFENFSEIGAKQEKDESKQKYILLSNILSLITFSVNSFTGILFFFFTTNKFAAATCLVTGTLLLIPVYFNAKGHHSFAKIYMSVFANTIVVVCCCLFSNTPYLKNYFFPITITCAFLFSYKELQWLIISMIISLGCYTIEATPLRHYLPAYHFDFANDFNKDKLIIQASCLLFTILDVFAFIYISKLQENQITQKQKILEATQYELQVQNEDLQTFSIAASHSLQTPIYVSKFFLGKVRQNYEDLSQKNTNLKSMDIVADSLKQMDQLVSGLFSYSRIIKIEEAYTTFNITDELVLIKKRMEEKFTGRKVIIPSENLSITTSQILLSIIIQNLADNGLKYNTSEKPEIKLYFKQTGKLISFFVSDNGIGIEKENFNKIFEPFKRLQPNSEFKGNGLGLSGARRAAERIGGKLFCKESSGSGTVFQLDLPVVPYKKEAVYPMAQTGSLNH